MGFFYVGHRGHKLKLLRCLWLRQKPTLKMEDEKEEVNEGETEGDEEI